MKFELEMLPFAFEAEAQGEQQEARRSAARSAARAARSGGTAGAGRTSVRTSGATPTPARPRPRPRPRPRGRPIVGSRVYYPIPVYNPFAQGGAWPEPPPAPAAEPAPPVAAAPAVAEPVAAAPGMMPPGMMTPYGPMPPFGAMSPFGPPMPFGPGAPAMPGADPGSGAAPAGPPPAITPQPFSYPPASDAGGAGANAGADAAGDGAADAGHGGNAGNSDAGDGDAGDGAAEIPQAIFDFLRNNRTNPQIPQYDGYKTGLKRQGKPIQDVVNDPALKGQSGVYLITFDHQGKRRAYSGKAKDLQARLKQHLATLSFPVGLPRQYQVYVQPTANVAIARSLERQINQRRAQFGQALVNRTTELEFALFA